jgi:hypothetical protein
MHLGCGTKIIKTGCRNQSSGGSLLSGILHGADFPRENFGRRAPASLKCNCNGLRIIRRPTLGFPRRTDKESLQARVVLETCQRRSPRTGKTGSSAIHL